MRGSSPGSQDVSQVSIKIVSASYGPSEGRRLQTGELSRDEKAYVPYTRDVTPFLRALLLQHQDASHPGRILVDQAATRKESPSLDSLEVKMDTTTEVGGMQRTFLPLLKEGVSMNAVFGDPCPGTSKRLCVHYIVSEVSESIKSEAYDLSFAEHERVILRKRVSLCQDDEQLKLAVVQEASLHPERTSLDFKKSREDLRRVESTLQTARRIGRSQSMAEFGEDGLSIRQEDSAASISPPVSNVRSTHGKERKWRLRSAVSEIALPIVLPFLDYRERVLCQLVCRMWRLIVRDWGVATIIDNNDSAFPLFSRDFFRGILSHSYSSLQCLFLSGFEDLAKEDLHPSIPHLRKIRSLDISRCYQLDDSTLQLLSQHSSKTLEVLYLKGLRQVTDKGLISICRSCDNLQVLEVSYLPITDAGGIAIGENLTKLRALYMRDNYKLTNQSIDVITKNCVRLAQLTLWGSTKLRHLEFDAFNEHTNKGSHFRQIVLLNLSGCHSLTDESAHALACMKGLRSLIVSECHRLTDAFVARLAQNVPQLNHLYMRYCKRLTDSAVDEITANMKNIYSLDLSFCTRITSAPLARLLETCYANLSELRLQNCYKLQLVRDMDGNFQGRELGTAGQAIIDVIKGHAGDHCLAILDVRDCWGGSGATNNIFAQDDPFVVGMATLAFAQEIPGFFTRPARWNQNVLKKILTHLKSDSGVSG